MTAETEGSSEPVILATAGYDHAIKFWQALSGICHRTVQHPDSVSFAFVKCNLLQIMKKKKKSYLYGVYRRKQNLRTRKT